MIKEVKKDTNRIAKVNSLIEHELGPILLEHLQGFGGIVTITKADTSKDMKWCKVWISILGPTLNLTKKEIEAAEGKKKGKEGLSPLDDKILNYLAKNIYEIQGELNKHFYTKIIPRISFHLDTSPRYVEHIEEVLRKIHEEER